MKKLLTSIALLTLFCATAVAQSPGDWLIPVKTAGGRTEKTVTLSNGQVLGKTAGNPAAVSLSDYLTSSTAASTYAPLASPTFTGTVTIPSGASISGYAPLASPTFTGVARAPTFTTVNALLPTRTISIDTNVGISWADVNGSGYSVTLKPLGAPSGNTFVNFPVVGDIVSTADTGTVTPTMLAGSIPISKLASSTSTALGLGSVELGHATDTTLARVSAGVASIEGATIATLSAANTFTQTQSLPGITGTGGGGLYLLINGNGTSGSMIGVTGYMPGLTVGSAGGIGFSSGAPSSGYDTVMRRAAAGIIALTTNTASTGSALQFRTQTAPGSAPSANQANIWLEDNGSGKLRLMIRFPTGAAQQIAIEP